jgi:dephospho-CoA kinase
MLKVGLTGGIAAGKSVVGEMFVQRGAHLIQADQLSHQLMQPGQPVYQEVVRHFGDGILNPDRSVNRPKLAEVAFSGRIQELNQIVHPAVLEKQREWMEQVGQLDPKAIAIVEAALILEAKFEGDFARMVVVTCKPEQRVTRWAQRMQVDEETARREVARRMAAQLPDEQKIKAADYVVDNSGPLDETQKQVQEIFRRLQREAKA